MFMKIDQMILILLVQLQVPEVLQHKRHPPPPNPFKIFIHQFTDSSIVLLRKYFLP